MAERNPPAEGSVLAGMRLIGLALAVLFLLAACGSTAGPTLSPTPPASSPTAPTSSPTPAPTVTPTVVVPTATPVLRPLPEGLSGIPGPGFPTVVIEPATRRGTTPPGVAQPFDLGHCGLISPIDFDGGLWDPIAGDDGAGGPLTDDQQGELVNATRVTLTLMEPNVIRLETPLGAVLTLERHPGARPYSLCD